MTAFLFILFSRNLEEKKTSFDLVVLVVENLLPNREDIRGTGSILGQEDLLEKDLAIHSSILAWGISVDRGAWQATVHRIAKSRT